MSGLRVLVCGVLLLLALCLDVVDAECKAGIKNKAGTRIKPKYNIGKITAFHLYDCWFIPKDLHCYVEVEDPPSGCTASVDGMRQLISNCKRVKSWIVRDGAPCPLDTVLLGATSERVSGSDDGKNAKDKTTTKSKPDAPLNDAEEGRIEEEKKDAKAEHVNVEEGKTMTTTKSKPDALLNDGSTAFLCLFVAFFGLIL